MNESTLNEIIIYQEQGREVAVRLDSERDTVWLRQEQMSKFFNRERSVITKHIRNIFKDGDLEEESNVQNLHIANSDRGIRVNSCIAAQCYFKT